MTRCVRFRPYAWHGRHAGGDVVSGRCVSSSAPPLGYEKKDKRKEQKEVLFEADWSFLSANGLSQIVKEILADFLGVSPPRESTRDFDRKSSLRRQSMANIEEIYSQKRLKIAAEQGYLVRALLYDASALMQFYRSNKSSSQRVQEAPRTLGEGDDQKVAVLKRGELAKRDWEAFVLHEGDVAAEEGCKEVGRDGGKAESVKVGMTVSELLAEEGDPLSGSARQQTLGRASRVRGDPGAIKEETAVPARQAPKSKQQELEKAMGKEGSVRAKYMAKIMERKLLAEVRQDRGKFSLGAASKPGPSRRPVDLERLAKEKSWVATAGSPGLLRHFRERGLLQGLLEPLQRGDLVYLQDQLGNFPFDPTAHIAPDQPISRSRLESICSVWGVKPRQVMLVVGAGGTSRSILQAVKSCGFFVTKMNGAVTLSNDGQVEKKTGSENENSQGLVLLAGGAKPIDSLEGKSGVLVEGYGRGVRGAKGGGGAHAKEGDSGLQTLGNRENVGVFSWYKKLAEGTLHVGDQKQQSQSTPFVHFTVSDMTELKWVIEDLNGVSYRQSTFVRGQDRGSLAPVVVMRKPVHLTPE